MMGAGGILLVTPGLSLQTLACKNLIGQHSKPKDPISLAHDILHNRAAILFSKYF